MGSAIFSSCHAPEAIPAAMATPKAVASDVVVRTIKKDKPITINTYVLYTSAYDKG